MKPVSVSPAAAPNLWIAAMPPLFVLIWSTGFIVAKYGLPYAPPLTFLLLRFACVLAVLLPLVQFTRAPWPVGQVGNIAFAGVMVQAGYLGGVWWSIKLGMPAGLSALIVGMQPILTALAARFVGENISSRQWLGLMFGLAGVGLVVASKLNVGHLSAASIGCSLFALLSITSGMLFQKRYCPQFDLRTGTAIQFAASLLVTLPFAIFFEHLTPRFETVHWTPQFLGALAWAVLALSIGAIFLLFALMRKNAATRVTSLLYLTPPTTALMAWLMFGEAFSLTGLAGLLIAVTGVVLVNKK